jgi:hypothetical protein
MKRIAIILIALALGTVAAADQWRDVDIEDLMKEIPGSEEHPDAKAVFALLQETIDVADDGSIETQRNLLVRILRLIGREAYANQSFLYDSEVAEISVEKAQTLRKTGRVVEVEEDAINDITPSFLADAGIYSNVLEKVISFPVVGAGSTMELQLKETKEPAKDGSFSGVEYFGGEDPFLRHEIALRFPDDVAVATEASDGIAELVELSEESKRGEITWTAEDIEALVPESDMPPRALLRPRVLYSSYGSWDEVAAFFAGEFFPHALTEGAVAEHAALVTVDRESDSDRMYACFIDVATSIRNVHLPLGLAGFEPNDAALVLENRYGDTRDKAVLLVSMLRAAGLSAYPALVNGAAVPLVETVPTLKQFTRLFVAVPGEQGYTFFDPFLDDVRMGYLRWGRGNTALVVKDDGTGELVEIPPFAPNENLARKTVTISLGNDGSAHVGISTDLYGYFDRKARSALKDATPSEKKDFFETSASALSPGGTDEGNEMSDIQDLTTPCVINQAVTAPDFAPIQGDFAIARIPAVPFEFTELGSYPVLTDRQLPFELPCEAASTHATKILLPPEFVPVRIPEDLTIELPEASFELTCMYDDDGSAIHWRETVILKQRRISVDRYAEFKEAWDTLASPKNRLVLLKKLSPFARSRE